MNERETYEAQNWLMANYKPPTHGLIRNEAEHKFYLYFCILAGKAPEIEWVAGK